MQKTVWMIVLVTVCTALAGCTDPAEEGSAVDSTAPLPGDSDNATFMNVSYANEVTAAAVPSNAFLFTIHATPEGTVAGYKIQLKEDAWWHEPGADQAERLFLDIAPREGQAGSITAWSLLLFTEVNDELVFVTEYHDTPHSFDSRGPLGTGPEERSASMEPAEFNLWEPNDPNIFDFYVVLAARGSEGALMDVAMRADNTQEDPFSNEAEPFDTIVMEETPGLIFVTPYGTGNGYRYEYYYDSLDLGMERTIEQTANAEVSNSGPEAAGYQPIQQQTTIEIASELGGFSRTSGYYQGGVGAGTWSVSIGYEGNEWARDGQFVELAGTIYGFLAYIVLERPDFVVQENEATDRTAEFSVNMVNVDEWEYLYMSQIQLGPTMEELTGLPAQQFAENWDGLLQDGI